jgi:hypothetical protein
MNCFWVGPRLPKHQLQATSSKFNHSPDVSDQNEIEAVDPILRTDGGGRGCDRLLTPHQDRLSRDP